MDQINGWPKQLLCLCAMTGLCREQFGHFMLMGEVSSAVVSCKPPLNYAHSLYLSFYVFLFSTSFSASLPCSLYLFYPSFLSTFWTFVCCCHPSFWLAISRSDPFIGNHCIFNLDLDNGTVTVIFAPGLFAALRPFMSLTLCIPPVTNYSHTDQFRAKATTEIMSMRHHIFDVKSQFLLWNHFLEPPHLSIESVVH